MRESDREEARHLRAMSSEDAADWIMRFYPEYPPAILDRRSWKRADQVKLFEYYFPRNFGFATARPTHQFLKIMSVRRFVGRAEAKLSEMTEDDLDLFAYYLPTAITDLKLEESEKELLRWLRQKVLASLSRA